jgi:hypothetical protein
MKPLTNDEIQEKSAKILKAELMGISYSDAMKVLEQTKEACEMTFSCIVKWDEKV